MTIYCGVDFHSRMQTLALCDATDAEIHQLQLNHQHDDIRQFYSQFNSGLIAGLEASGYTSWFEGLWCKVFTMHKILYMCFKFCYNPL